ncbi:uncharacterized protein LOC113764159 isoform X1 [Coffea eugenioides]|uniref:uncharacterized protein LOC113764159 isoform X1 n=1 Tax=Coffea eugenioides TaxID=49369 RepID=UPI000F614F44|nr:uncharacterized protein LOC113764159 isoform X1 [Coffea eugenioides]
MEPLLGFTEPPANDVVLDQSHSFKLVPWISWDEWEFVRISLFSSSPPSVASALQRITAWRSKGCLPVVVEVTASIVEIQQKDPFFRHDLPGEAVDSEEMLAMLYCMAIMRLVNGIIEKTRKKTEVSIAEAAGAIGIPRMLIDIRHEGSHRDLPSLHLVRIASMKALDWLKEYYWEPQKNAIPNQADVISNARVEIKHRLYELASCLRAKCGLRSGSSLVKGKRFKHLECLHGPNKFLSLMAMKYTNSKSSVSKKQVNKLLKNVRRLYSSFSGEVVDVLLELLLKAMDLSNMVELCENQETRHRSETIPTVSNAWKPVVIKLFKKEPELLWSLLKAVLIKIETKGGNNNEIDEHLSSAHIDESHQIEQLATLFDWLVRHLSAVKPLELKNSAAECEDFLIEKNHPKATIFELLRKCLVTCSHSNLQLRTSALVLARMLGDRSLISKLEKLLQLTGPDLDVSEAFPSNDSVSENFLSHEQESIDFAARSLELIKLHRRKTENLMSTNNNEKNTRWVIVKSWNPCPIGMLPQSLGSAGRFPDLDCNFEAPEIPTLAIRKDQWDPNQCSKKREPHSVADDLDKMNVKKIRKTIEGCEIDDQENLTSEDIKGHMMIGGVWKKASEEELLAIASAVRILV